MCRQRRHFPLSECAIFAKRSVPKPPRVARPQTPPPPHFLPLTTTVPPTNQYRRRVEKRVKMASKHSAADQAFLDGLPGRKLIESRNYMFTPSYITSNAGRFLDHEWIDIPALREFLGNSAPEAGSDASSTRSTRLSACPDLAQTLSAPPTSFKIRTSYEGGREVLEISSDSESDADEISGDLTRGASRSSSVYHPPDDNDTPDSDDEFPTVVSVPSVELIVYPYHRLVESDDESHASEFSKDKDVNDLDCDASKKGSSSRASSSGRVKTIPAPSRKGSSKSTRAAAENNTPIVDTPVPPSEHPQTPTFNSGESAHTTFGSEVGTINLPIDSSRPTDLEMCDPQVYSGALPLLPDLAGPSATPDTPMYDLNDLQLATLFGLGSDFSANIPVATPSGFSFSTTPQYSFSENPLAALNSFLPSAASPLPLLPPPPPDSPPGSAPSSEELYSNSVTSKSKRAPRSKLDGLEPANILATGSARTKASSSRKRDAEKEDSEQPSKKRKKNKV
ncbi:hypothetical protein B0H11DRAFT_2365550 [Mycena galericulata]|nr:hypothetical protein B0H11DRAFT_2365550 [Mycena galericulata]